MLWSICWRCWFSLVREGWHGRARFGCVHEHGLVFEEPKPERHSSDLINQMMSDEVKLLPLSLLPIGIATDPTPSSPSGRASKAKQSKWLIPAGADKLHYYGTVQGI
jgi:hypothetical protein